MDGWGRGRGRGRKQPQEQRGDQGSAIDQKRGLRAEEGDQVAMAINRMTDLLERIVDRQGQEPVIQPGGLEGGVDRALKWFRKNFPPKFMGGLDPEIAKSWFERMIDIFAILNYTEEQQVSFTVYQLEWAKVQWGSK